MPKASLGGPSNANAGPGEVGYIDLSADANVVQPAPEPVKVRKPRQRPAAEDKD